MVKVDQSPWSRESSWGDFQEPGDQSRVTGERMRAVRGFAFHTVRTHDDDGPFLEANRRIIFIATKAKPFDNSL